MTHNRPLHQVFIDCLWLVLTNISPFSVMIMILSEPGIRKLLCTSVILVEPRRWEVLLNRRHLSLLHS